MTTNRPKPGQSKPGSRRPPQQTVSGRFYIGIFLLAVVLLSLYFIWKPFDPPTEYLTVSVPVGTSQETVKKAVTDTLVLDVSNVRISQEGLSFTISSVDIKKPIATDVWKRLASALPAKLAGAKTIYKADPPPLINLGLDLQGGLRVVLKAMTPNPSREDVDRVRTIIENRVNQTGVAEPLVQIQGNDRVVVELPGISKAERGKALNLIGQTAKLDFRIVNETGMQKTVEEMTLTDLGPVVLDGKAIKNAQVAFNQVGAAYVQMEFTPEGGKKFADLTAANVGKQMAIVLDDKVKSAPRIEGAISGGTASITGSFTIDEASEIALVLRSGALPVPIEAIETREIGPTLGQDAIRSGLTASVIGIAAVFFLVFIYYGLWFGLVASAGLIFSGLTIFGILSGMGATLTLPGIAGLVLTIGAAVDGNVISFERIKEELRLKKGIKQGIRAGFSHSLATILDVNLSHLLSAVALYSFSTGPVKGFAVTLAVGVIASTFSNLVFSRWALESIAAKKNFSAPQWFATPKINFIASSKVITTGSILLAIIGAIFIFSKPFNYGVDFTSGTSITLRTATRVSSEQVRSAVGSAGVAGVTAGGSSIIEAQTPGTNGKDFTIRVGDLKEAQRTQLETSLTKLPGGQVIQVESVGPAVGNELRQMTIIAALVALGLILIYVWFRFDLIFGVASVLAVGHDVAIVLGLFNILGREFSITTVAAILTLIGYSLNDSIIVSDRIRENLKVMRGKPYREVVNVSINQTLSRTVMTSVATMLPLIALLIFGGPVLRDFSLALLVGIIVGTYSSIYIVAPMVVYYKEWQDSRKKSGRAITSKK